MKWLCWRHLLWTMRWRGGCALAKVDGGVCLPTDGSRIVEDAIVSEVEDAGEQASEKPAVSSTPFPTLCRIVLEMIYDSVIEVSGRWSDLWW